MEPTKEQLEELKNIELQMLRVFVEICEKENLKYYLLGGTLLGAVRHKGFIPWDDDIDVGMPRTDYEKFVSGCQKYMPKDYFIQTFETDPEYPANFAKIRNSKTTFIESSLKNCKINHGVYIDVFPLDFYPDNESFCYSAKKLLLSLRISDAFSVSGMKMKTKAVRMISRIIYPSVGYAVKKREEFFKSVTGGKRIANHCGAWGKKEIVPAKWYGEGKKLVFEGTEVSVPLEYEKWLTQVYGDYMQLPPPEKRIGHHFTEIVDLEKPYTYYTEKKDD